MLKRPTVALAYSGDFRALDIMHDSVTTATASLGAKCLAFFWLDQLAATQCSAAGHCMRPRSMSTKDDQRWTAVSDEYVHAIVKQQYASANRHFYRPYNASNSGLCLAGVTMQSPEQYDKLQRVFRAIVAYEAAQKNTFEWLIRLRTDMLFLGGLPPLPSLASDRIYVPVGHVNPRVALNDHMAIVPRSHASAYFNAADDLSCDASRHSPGKRVNRKGGAFLPDRLRNLGIRVQAIDIGYVLLRGRFGAVCWRLKNQRPTVHWWEACLNLSVAMPVYCRTMNGTCHPHQCTGEEGGVNVQKLSVLNTPLCHQLPAVGPTMQLEVFQGKEWPPERGEVAE